MHHEAAAKTKSSRSAFSHELFILFKHCSNLTINKKLKNSNLFRKVNNEISMDYTPDGFFFPKSCSLRLIFYFFALSTTMLYCQLSSKNSLRERGFWTMEPEKCLINVVFSSIALFNTSKNFFCRSFFPRRSLLHTTKRIFDVGNRAKKNFVPTDYNIFI